MNKNRPKVSVLLSVHNHENYVGQAIESVLRQTFQDWELIIIDDCSQDRSPDVARQYQDERIQFYRSEENKGAILTFNELLKKAAGEYIASLDSDDVWYDNKLEEQAHYIPQQTRNAIVIFVSLCIKIGHKRSACAIFLIMIIICAAPVL